jgi:aspartyl-tRNA(Asn)/glutamyl-tRNA(Gln) amidotransferase subunit A
LLETGRVGADARGLIEPGAAVSGVEYVRARNAQWEYACEWGRFMTDYDLFVSPAMECVAYEHGLTGPPTLGGEPIGDFYDDYCHFCYPFNLTGQPAMSVPMGTAEHGLPVGLQIVGPRLHDDVVLRAAAAWEGLAPWPRPPADSRLAQANQESRVAAGARVVDDAGVAAEVRRAFSPHDGELVVEYD